MDRPMDDELDPKEAARARRRDRDAGAQARALLRPGMGKVFKQILDAQARAARNHKGNAKSPSATPHPGDPGERGDPTDPA
jgi:hypothetical protein